jgi:hypothetical protein
MKRLYVSWSVEKVYIDERSMQVTNERKCMETSTKNSYCHLLFCKEYSCSPFVVHSVILFYALRLCLAIRILNYLSYRMLNQSIVPGAPIPVKTPVFKFPTAAHRPSDDQVLIRLIPTVCINKNLLETRSLHYAHFALPISRAIIFYSYKLFF